MKFRNTVISLYSARMLSAAPRPLLARLRSSARLAVLVLLVFAVKIGAAAACAKHDFIDLGIGADSSQAVMKAISANNGDADLGKTLPGHAGTCTHCECHHAAAVVPTAHLSLAITTNGLTACNTGPPPSASPLQELRPPIA